MQAMVACAGLGERLHPLTTILPKPACPVLDRPLVHYNLALLRGIGVDEVVVNTHALPAAMESAARSGCAELGLQLHLSHEPLLLGTGGGLKRAEQWLGDDTFVLLNGKILCDADLSGALEAHRREAAAATLLVVDLPPNEGYRPVYAGDDDRLLYIPGAEPATPKGSPFLFSGIHLLEPEIFAHLPTVTDRPYGIFEHGYRGLMGAGAKVRVHRLTGAFHDPSTPRRYLRANLDAASGRFPLERFAMLGLAPARPDGNFVGEGTRVMGEVRESVIAHGVHVPAGARLERSVIWPNTRLGENERIENCIAAGNLRVVVETVLGGPRS
jgi:mannose-1-phosphate guanylyltransferase